MDCGILSCVGTTLYTVGWKVYIRVDTNGLTHWAMLEPHSTLVHTNSTGQSLSGCSTNRTAADVFTTQRCAAQHQPTATVWPLAHSPCWSSCQTDSTDCNVSQTEQNYSLPMLWCKQFRLISLCLFSSSLFTAPVIVQLRTSLGKGQVSEQGTRTWQKTWKETKWEWRGNTDEQLLLQDQQGKGRDDTFICKVPLHNTSRGWGGMTLSSAKSHCTIPAGDREGWQFHLQSPIAQYQQGTGRDDSFICKVPLQFMLLLPVFEMSKYHPSQLQVSSVITMISNNNNVNGDDDEIIDNISTLPLTHYTTSWFYHVCSCENIYTNSFTHKPTSDTRLAQNKHWHNTATWCSETAQLVAKLILVLTLTRLKSSSFLLHI